MLNIVLINPEIPQNTGNIARTCVATNARLHLIKPLGFELSDKYVKRAGMDYFDKLDYIVYEDFNDFLNNNKDCNMFLLTTKAAKDYTKVNYTDDCYLFFGPESKGINEQLILDNFDKAVRIPMFSDIRSLNLSNAVAIVAYEALRQNEFKDLRKNSEYFKGRQK